MVIQAYSDEKKNENKALKAELYNSAYLTAVFVGKMLAGKSIPQIHEVFPELAQDVQKEQESKPAEPVDNSWILIKERMIDFANEANKHKRK